LNSEASIFPRRISAALSKKDSSWERVIFSLFNYETPIVCERFITALILRLFFVQNYKITHLWVQKHSYRPFIGDCSWKVQYRLSAHNQPQANIKEFLL